MSEENTELLKARAEADALGIEYHHRAKAETIWQSIAEHQTARMKEQEAVQQEPPPSMVDEDAPKHDNSAQDVLDAVQSLIDAKPGFIANVDDETWHFKYRGKEDSGNNKIPLRVIKMKAQSVAQGGFAAAAIKDGKDTVLMA